MGKVQKLSVPTLIKQPISALILQLKLFFEIAGQLYPTNFLLS